MELHLAADYQLPENFRALPWNGHQNLLAVDDRNNTIEISTSALRLQKRHIADINKTFLSSCNAKKTENSSHSLMCTVSIVKKSTLSLFCEDGDNFYVSLPGELNCIFPFKSGFLLQLKGSQESRKLYFLSSMMSTLREVVCKGVSYIRLLAVCDESSIICSHSIETNCVEFYEFSEDFVTVGADASPLAVFQSSLNRNTMQSLNTSDTSFHSQGHGRKSSTPTAHLKAIGQRSLASPVHREESPTASASISNANFLSKYIGVHDINRELKRSESFSLGTSTSGAIGMTSTVGSNNKSYWRQSLSSTINNNTMFESIDDSPLRNQVNLSSTGNVNTSIQAENLTINVSSSAPSREGNITKVSNFQLRSHFSCNLINSIDIEEFGVHSTGSLQACFSSSIDHMGYLLLDIYSLDSGFFRRYSLSLEYRRSNSDKGKDNGKPSTEIPNKKLISKLDFYPVTLEISDMKSHNIYAFHNVSSYAYLSVPIIDINNVEKKIEIPATFFTLKNTNESEIKHVLVLGKNCIAGVFKDILVDTASVETCQEFSLESLDNQNKKHVNIHRCFTVANKSNMIGITTEQNREYICSLDMLRQSIRDSFGLNNVICGLMLAFPNAVYESIFSLACHLLNMHGGDEVAVLEIILLAFCKLEYSFKDSLSILLMNRIITESGQDSHSFMTLSRKTVVSVVDEKRVNTHITGKCLVVLKQLLSKIGIADNFELMSNVDSTNGVNNNNNNSQLLEALRWNAFPNSTLLTNFYELFCQRKRKVENNPKKGSMDTYAHMISDAFSAVCDRSQIWRIHYFPSSLQYLIQVSLLQCQHLPNRNWSSHLLRFLSRHDIVLTRSSQRGNFRSILVHARRSKGGSNGYQSIDRSSTSSGKGSSSGGVDATVQDGLYEVELQSSLRFTTDERVHEVCRMLRSSNHYYLRLEKSPEVTDMEHRAKLQLKLLTLCRRGLSCCVGRGMVTFSTTQPQVAEALTIPKLSLSGRVQPTNSILNLEVPAAPAELTLWPNFHNGVAIGLQIGANGFSSRCGSLYNSSGNRSNGTKTPSCGMQNHRQRGIRNGVRVSRNWIIYNKSASAATGMEGAHAGFLLALGLQGHLNILSVSDICDYLTKGHEPTTVSILLGTAASKLGSADSLLSKTLCLHLPSLLPPMHLDVEISPVVQCAALVGLGLLHCMSAHRLMIEYLLSELTRRPPTDRFETREAMSLAASWALGMILLTKGSSIAELKGISDLAIEDRLQLLIDGGPRPSDSSLFPTLDMHADSNSKNSRILETSAINTAVTAPGAMIALALMYLMSKDKGIAARLSVPKTAFSLSSQRSDLLFYRTLSISLVLWDDVIPTDEWIKKQIPQIILDSHDEAINDSENSKSPHPMAKKRETSTILDPSVALCSYLTVYSGYCFGIGLIFAGTCDERAKSTLLKFLRVLQSYRESKASPFTVGKLDKVSRGIIELCTCAISVALGCLCAGSGDLHALQILRELRWRCDEVTFGSHMSISMGLGMLFLSGGDASLKRDPVSIACLLMSMLPRFPYRTIDNQFHTQACRHLYALAVESRVLYVIDSDSGESVNVSVQVKFLDNSEKTFQAPCLLPELASIVSLEVSDNDQYFGTQVLIDKKDTGNDAFRSRISSGHLSMPPIYLQRKKISDCRIEGTKENWRLQQNVPKVANWMDQDDPNIGKDTKAIVYEIMSNASVNSMLASSICDFTM